MFQKTIAALETVVAALEIPLAYDTDRQQDLQELHDKIAEKLQKITHNVEIAKLKGSGRHFRLALENLHEVQNILQNLYLAHENPNYDVKKEKKAEPKSKSKFEPKPKSESESKPKEKKKSEPEPKPKEKKKKKSKIMTKEDLVKKYGEK